MQGVVVLNAGSFGVEVGGRFTPLKDGQRLSLLVNGEWRHVVCKQQGGKIRPQVPGHEGFLGRLCRMSA